MKKRNSSQFTGLNAKGKKIVETIKKLENIGINGTETRKSPNLQIKQNGTFVKDGDYYSQTYAVNSNVNIDTYKIDQISNFPSGSYIADINGNEKTLFDEGETFKVMIPKSKMSNDINGTIKVSSKCETYPILYGKTRVPGTQDYNIVYDKYENATANATFNVKTNTGKVQVNKVDAETSHPIEGVEFRLSKKDGTKIETAKTNSKGIAIFENLYPGEYELKELSTDENYILNSETFNISVNYNETTIKKITNESRKGQIKVIKVDKEEDVKLEGVEFEVLDESDNVLEKIVTNEKGEAITKKYPLRYFTKLKIREVKTLNNYVLGKEVQTVKLEADSVKEVVITNVKKRGQIEITKISADNNEITGQNKGALLKGAIFEIYTDDNKLVDTITTNEKGKAISGALEYGDYYIKEVDTGSKDYELNKQIYTAEIREDGELVHITIENKSKDKPLPKTGF